MTQVLTSESKVDTSGVPFAVTDRCFIPRERYIDRNFFELENIANMHVHLDEYLAR